MSHPLIECVPNISEGRDRRLIEQICDEIRQTQGAQLLNIDPGESTNRTVITFIGTPDAVEEAAFRLIRKASQLIDMRTHQGNHPRMGATDVCPFIPISDTTMADCVKIAKRLGLRVGEELKIPIYLYEEAASSPERKNLATIRKGEYEGFAEKINHPDWVPDFGPMEFNLKSGATVIGAREFLIAFNINLNTRDKEYANDIAFELRKKGRSVRTGNIHPFYFKGTLTKYREGFFPCGEDSFVGKTFEETVEYCKSKYDYDLVALLAEHSVPNPFNPVNYSVRKTGKFDYCKAIGWFAAQYDCAQISINLTNYKITSIHEVLEETRKLAYDRSLIVTGSEIVGLVPFQPLYDSGKYYLEKQGKSTGIPYPDVLKTAVQSLGLKDVAPFVIEEKVLGLPKTYQGSLIQLKTSQFVDEVSRETPAPGGGSVAALSGALGAALASMVANLTIGREENGEDQLKQMALRSQEIKDSLLMAVDQDTNAFNSYLEALKLPQKTEAEKIRRKQQIQAGLELAIQVPLNTAKWSLIAMGLAHTAVNFGKSNSVSDAGVASQVAYAGVKGGIYNVLINVRESTQAEYIQQMQKLCAEIDQQAIQLREKTEQLVREKLASLPSQKKESRSEA
ncbi:MAG: glutamate formimidoyltransferase [Planctomycetota bacterium]